MSVALVMATPALSYAHATLISADPSAGSTLLASPRRIRLVFSEQLEASLGRISIEGSDGKVVRLAAAGDPHDVYSLVAPLDSLAPGEYRVTWRVVSADGHPVEGTYRFIVSSPDGATTARPAPVPPPNGAPANAARLDSTIDSNGAAAPTFGPSIAGAPVIASLLRGLALATLMGATGLLVFLSWFGRASVVAAPRAIVLARWLALAALLFLALHFCVWVVNAAGDHGLNSETIAAVLASSVGHVELWRLGLALLAAVAIALARWPRLALPFAVGALCVSGITGHSVVIRPLWTVPAKALHLLAAAVWLGGLLWLLTFDRDDVRRFARHAGRVSSVALSAVIIVTLSGLVQTWFFVHDPNALIHTAYGIVTLAKIAGLLVLVAFGAYHRKRVLPWLAVDPENPARFAATLRDEVGVMIVVVLLGGLLGYLPPPPRDPSFDSPPPSADQ